MLFTVYSTKKKAKDRGEGKGRHCCLGHVLDCRTNHSILTNFFRRTSILVRWGLVWCEPDEHSFFKVSILSRGLYYIHSFLQNHPGGKYLVRQGIESIPSPQTAATTFAFSSAFIFLLCSTCFIANLLLSKLKPRLCSSPFTISSTSYVIGMFALYHSSPCSMVRYINEPPLKNEPQHL